MPGVSKNRANFQRKIGAKTANLAKIKAPVGFLKRESIINRNFVYCYHSNLNLD